MRQPQDYIFEARKKQNIYSNNKLATAIGITGGSICAIMRKRALPAPETIIKLAELAGISKEEALLDLSIWKAQTPEEKSAWEKIRDTMKVACLFGILSFFILTGTASASPIENLPSITSNPITNYLTIHYATNLPSSRKITEMLFIVFKKIYNHSYFLLQYMSVFNKM